MITTWNTEHDHMAELDSKEQEEFPETDIECEFHCWGIHTEEINYEDRGYPISNTIGIVEGIETGEVYTVAPHQIKFKKSKTKPR